MVSIPLIKGRATPATTSQEPFARVALVLKTALLMGAGGGFVLAAVLTVTEATGANLGALWGALVQAHGHVQLYGWAGLFVIGVALHFLPRLRGTPLAAPRLVHWVLGFVAASLILRVIAQPMVAASGAGFWRGALLTSGVLECAGVGALLWLLLATGRRCRALGSRNAELTIAPLVLCAFAALGLAAAVNAVNVAQAATSPLGIVPPAGDGLNVTLGLFGFLVPFTLAMSVQMLPMYAGIAVFPRRIVLPSALFYALGLALLAVGTMGGSEAGGWSGTVAGAGMVLLGATLLAYVGVFVYLMGPQKMRPHHETSAPAAEPRQRGKPLHLAYGPFVAVVASAYLWALLGGVLLFVNGWAELAGGQPAVNPDAVRHSLTIGYIALLICGVSSRMLPGLSGRRIAAAWLVRATLWLGNGAALLRVGSLLVAPLLTGAGSWAHQLDQAAFGASGPFGLLLAAALVVNLWPALSVGRSATSSVGYQRPI